MRASVVLEQLPRSRWNAPWCALHVLQTVLDLPTLSPDSLEACSSRYARLLLRLSTAPARLVLCAVAPVWMADSAVLAVVRVCKSVRARRAGCWHRRIRGLEGDLLSLRMLLGLSFLPCSSPATPTSELILTGPALARNQCPPSPLRLALLPFAHVCLSARLAHQTRPMTGTKCDSLTGSPPRRSTTRYVRPRLPRANSLLHSLPPLHDCTGLRYPPPDRCALLRPRPHPRPLLAPPRPAPKRPRNAYPRTRPARRSPPRRRRSQGH